ncbi:MAG TPA: ABC transporter permease [Vicinamibacterales bacterium]|nr:ABC transporter permease [Vicinamibacterales bacterium]
MASARVTTIQPAHPFFDLDLHSLYEFRELLGFLIWRDVKVRYRQTVVGVAWFALQPILATLIFSIVFGRLAGLPSEGVPYPVFAYTGVLVWHFFAQAVSRGVNSMVAERNLIAKVYFPRLLLPLGVLLAGVVDLAVGFVILAAMLAWYGVAPTGAILLAPLFVILALTTALAMVSWLAPLNVRYRDVSHTMPFLLQIWMFASPVAYSVELIPAQWRWVYGLNPVAGIVEGFRWACLGTTPPSASLIGASVAGVLILLAAGVIFFHRMERTFADSI